MRVFTVCQSNCLWVSSTGLHICIFWVICKLFQTNPVRNNNSSLRPDEVYHFVCPNLGQNYLQRFSAGNMIKSPLFTRVIFHAFVCRLFLE